MKPDKVKPGMKFPIRDSRGKVIKTILITDVKPCPGTTKGVGKTHINGDKCYDNIADIDVV